VQRYSAHAYDPSAYNADIGCGHFVTESRPACEGSGTSAPALFADGEADASEIFGFLAAHAALTILNLPPDVAQ